MGLPPERLAMVGDTLHTDVLGGRAAGMGAVLVAEGLAEQWGGPRKAWC